VPPDDAGGKPGTRKPAADTVSGGAPKLRAACHRAAGRWTCAVRRAGARRVVVTCTGRSRAATARRCLAKAAERLGPTGRAATLDWQGFPASTIPAVGRLIIDYPGGYGTCSGTVVSRTLVLTAGHCFEPYNGSYPTGVVFLPGATWTSSTDKLDHSMPYGKWIATHWWQTGAWQSGHDGALDWALVEIPPADNGQPISAYTGSWRIQPGINFSRGAQIYAAGYPSSGYWATAAAGLGRGQYACSMTWDGEWQSIGSGWELFSRCTMNRGASGGPWFVRLSDGSWVIGGINNRCKSRWDTATAWCDPYADYMRSSYIDNRFNTFWNSVQPLLTYR
jgi:hypothetical protein